MYMYMCINIHIYIHIYINHILFYFIIIIIFLVDRRSNTGSKSAMAVKARPAWRRPELDVLLLDGGLAD